MEEKNVEKKENAAPEFIMKRLLDSRTVFICGEINQELAREVSTQLILLKSVSNEPVTIFLNSQGGHVEAGDTIHDMIRYVDLPIHMVGTGWVASAGITIFLAAPKESRVCLPNTRFMIHQPSGGVRGQATDIVIEATELKRIRARVEKLISEATGQPLDKVSADADRNYWMDTGEALDYGIIARVIGKQGDL